MEKRQDRLALDRARVSARTFDEDGHMVVADTPISKATVNPYRGTEIPNWEELGLDPDRIYQLLRDPKELEKAAPSFDGKPLLLIHKAIHSGDHDHSIVCGNVGSPYWDAPYLRVKRFTVWTDEAKQIIDDESQREISSAYRYRMDPTPGTYEGQRFDGVMRDISGSHIALVKEGRAGPDVMVGDSINGMKDIISMTKPAALSRTAIGAPIALAVLMKPKLAADAKIDWSPLFKGVTAKNFASKKAGMALDIKRQATGKLAKDATLEDVTELLDALEEVIPGEGPDVEFKQLTDMPKAGEDPVGDADDAELRAFLKTLGLSDEDIDKACAMASSPAVEDSAPDDKGSGLADGGGSTATVVPAETPTGATFEPSSAKDKAAMDAKIKDMERRLAASKTAMDQALVAERQNQRDIRDAERIVEADARVGQIKVACDSADDVYRAALTVMNVDVAELPKGAARAVYNAIPAKPLAPRALVAQDAAATAEYEKMFPNANRLKN